MVDPGSDSSYDPAAIAAARDRLFVLSGCSGGGKSAVLAELARRGQRVFPEAGRQVIREQNHIGGDGVPGRDALKFVELSASRALHQMILASGDPRPAFFDRSMVDQVSYLERLGLAVPPALENAVQRCRYHRRVFFVPPWPEIFRNDPERTQSFDGALANYAALLRTYERLGYERVMLPQASVAARADFVLRILAGG